jgi:hypothetical protein
VSSGKIVLKKPAADKKQAGDGMAAVTVFWGALVLYVASRGTVARNQLNLKL